MKTRLYNFGLGGLQGYTLFFLFLLKNIDCGYPLKPPRQIYVATLKKFYRRHHDLVNPYNVAVSRIVSDVFASDAP